MDEKYCEKKENAVGPTCWSKNSSIPTEFMKCYLSVQLQNEHKNIQQNMYNATYETAEIVVNGMFNKVSRISMSFDLPLFGNWTFKIESAYMLKASEIYFEMFCTILLIAVIRKKTQTRLVNTATTYPFI